MLVFADYFFLIFHTLLILFNLFGWIFKPLRKLHFVVILLTFACWFGLGIWYGWGYCPVTDWHWTVLRKLGHTHLPSSYVGYLIQRALGIRMPPLGVDMMTVGLAILALIASIKVNFFYNKKNI
jgi:hypothetical protein